MSVDPLAEKFPYNSTYAFQENKMGLGRELEGLELVNWDMSFKDNVRMNYHAAKSFATSVINDAANLSELGVNPVAMYNTGKGLVNAIANPVETGKAIVNNVIQTFTDMGSSNPQVAGEAYGKTTAFVAETVIGAEFAGAEATGIVDDLSNAAKGKLGETLTRVKYGAKGYVDRGKAEVLTGGKTATGRNARALYDHAFENKFTGKQLTVESKFNTSGLTGNQRAAAGNVTTSGGLIINRTTSQGVGRAAGAATSGVGAGISAQKEREY